MGHNSGPGCAGGLCFAVIPVATRLLDLGCGAQGAGHSDAHPKPAFYLGPDECSCHFSGSTPVLFLSRVATAKVSFAHIF